MKTTDEHEIILLDMDTALVIRGDEDGNILGFECYIPDGDDEMICPNTVFAISLIATMMSDEADDIRERLVQMMEMKSKGDGGKVH